MKNLLVNEDACIGCGSCIAVDPEHFDFNEDGLAKVVNTTNLETNAVINAIGSCPTGAISIDGTKGSCDCSNCPGCAHDNNEDHGSCNCGCED